MLYIEMAAEFLKIAGILFWIFQIIRVPLTDTELFEDHKHKLIWFLVVVFVPILGAVWFAAWRSESTARRARRRAVEHVRKIAQAYTAEERSESA
jgi:hypothetical protein